MVLGITGTDGAGKGAVVDILVERYGFVHYSSRSLIEAEIALHDLAVSREQLRLTANQMRAREGDDVMVKRALAQMAITKPPQVIIESIRAMAEVATLRAHGGILLAVDADIQLRYERIVGRGSSSDHVSFEQFVAQEALEANDPDPHGMQKAAVMATADYTIMNDGTLGELAVAVDAFMSKYA